jgi:hypothetical protein
MPNSQSSYLTREFSNNGRSVEVKLVMKFLFSDY